MRKTKRGYVAVFKNVPNGRWLLRAVIRDLDSGVKASAKRFVRVR